MQLVSGSHPQSFPDKNYFYLPRILREESPYQIQASPYSWQQRTGSSVATYYRYSDTSERKLPYTNENIVTLTHVQLGFHSDHWIE
jgi:hypothetical protein